MCDSLRTLFQVTLMQHFVYQGQVSARFRFVIWHKREIELCHLVLGCKNKKVCLILFFNWVRAKFGLHTGMFKGN